MADLNTGPKPTQTQSEPMPALDSATVEGTPEESTAAKTAPPSTVAVGVKEVAATSGPLGKADAQSPALLPCEAKPEPPPPKKLPQNITYNQPSGITYPAPLVDTVHFLAKSDSGLPVRFTIQSPDTPPRPPSVTIVATCPGNDKYEDAPPKSVTITVRKGKQTIEFKPETTKFVYGTEIGKVLNAKVLEEGGGVIYYESPAGTALDLKKVPDCPKISVAAKARESDLYQAVTGNTVTFTVEPIECRINWEPKGPFTHQVKLGNIFDATLEPWPEGSEISYSAKPGTTFPAGTRAIKVTVKPPNRNYVVKPKDFPIEVLKLPQVIAWGKIADFPYGPEVAAAKVQLAQNKTSGGGKLTYFVRKVGDETETPFVPNMTLNAGQYVMIAYAAETAGHRVSDAKSAPFRITKKPQTVEWSPLPKVQVGAGLREDQQTARVTGNPSVVLVYAPQGEGTAKQVGPQKFLVDVTAKESENYQASKPRTFKLEVVKGTRTLKWNKPDFGKIKHGDPFAPTAADVTVDPPVSSGKIRISTFTLSPGVNGVYASVEADAMYEGADDRAEVTVIDCPQQVTYKPSTIPYKEKLAAAHLNGVIEEGNKAGGLVYAVTAGNYPDGKAVAPPVASAPFEIRATVKAGGFFQAWSGVAAKVTVVRAKPELSWAPPKAILEGTATPFPNPAFVAGKGEVSPDCWQVPLASSFGGGRRKVTAKSKQSANYEVGEVEAYIVVVAKDHTKAISEGHAWKKHVLGEDGGRADWNPAPATNADFDTIVKDVVSRAVANGTYKVKDTKAYFWSDGRIVCYDPGSHDKGTCFKPDGPAATGAQGKGYYDLQ